MGASLTLPVQHGRLALGTWQGIYLNEHRRVGSPARQRLTVGTFHRLPRAASWLGVLRLCETSRVCPWNQCFPAFYLMRGALLRCCMQVVFAAAWLPPGICCMHSCDALPLPVAAIPSQGCLSSNMVSPPSPPPLGSCCRNYGGPRRLVITIQGQRRADGRKYSSYR